MGTIRIDKLEIETQLPMLALLDFKIKAEPDRHSTCYLKIQCAASLRIRNIEEFLKNTRICIKELNEGNGEIHKVIFSGVIEDVCMVCSGKVLIAEIIGISNSVKMDRDKKQQSFQNTQMTYYEVAKGILGNYPGGRIVWNLDKKRKIEKPLIQYKETDWEFLVRLVSHFNSSIIVSECEEFIEIVAGIKDTAESDSIEGYTVGCGVSPLYYKHNKWRQERNKKEYLYCIIKNDKNKHLGDAIWVSNNKKFIFDKKVVLENGEIVFYYRAGSKVFFKKDILYNAMFRGLQLEGQVKKAEGENVYISLDIDKNQPQELYPYPWMPVIGDFFYCMPELGTKVSLRFWNSDERETAAVYSVRENGQSCSIYHDSQKRVIETINDISLKLFPDELTLCNVDVEGKQEISLKDDKGICISNKGIFEICAEEAIVLKAGKVQYSSPVGIIQRVGQSNMEIHQDFNLYSPSGLDSVHLDTVIRESEKDKRKKEYCSVPCWQGACSAMGSVALFGCSVGEITIMEIVSMASIPAIGGGRTTVAVSQAVGGISNNNEFSNALHAVKINTVNGGYPLPNSIKKKQGGVFRNE